MKTPEDNKDKSFSPTPYVIAGYSAIFLTFGVFGTWAATAPLASGVVASGVVSVEGNRKTVQHLEGGLITKISVKEGDLVEAGDILIELDKTEAMGNFSVWEAKMISLRATQARMLAESVDAPEIKFPPELTDNMTPEVEAAMALQQGLFEDRRKTRDGRISILQARISQLKGSSKGLVNQLDSVEKQNVSMNEELDRLKRGLELKVVAANQISQVTRNFLELQNQRGKIESEISKVSESVSETELQILQTRQEFSERAFDEYKQASEQLSEIEEKFTVAQDVLARTTIRAPLKGKVQGLRVHTTSGVIRSGDPLMDIVPLDDDLLINAQIRPIDIDNVDPNAQVEVRFAAFSSKKTPTMFGKIEVLSRDVIETGNGNEQPYYSAFVKVDDKDIPDNLKGRLIAGMPADVIVSTGERTFAEYLIKPLVDSFYKGLKEK